MVKNTRRLLNLSGFLVMIFVPAFLFSDYLSDERAERKYSKWKWQDATLAAVLTHISAVAEVDIVVDPKIAADKVSVILRDKTWQEVFKIVCTMRGLSYQKLDDYIYVVDEKDFVERQVREAQTVRNLEAIEDLETVILKLQNTTAEEMADPVKGLLSQRGKVTIVEHTNSLIVHELAKNLDLVRSYVKEMDQEMLQISISAKIVEVSSGNQNDLGIQWSFFDGKGMGVSHLPTAEKGTGIIEQALERATYGVLDAKGFSIALEYLFTEANSEIVAEPQITTLENKEAKIFMGSKIPLSYLDYAGNVTVELIDAGTELTVTPTVTGKGRIKMALNPVKKSYTMTEQGPIINEQGAETHVVVQDGETVVIAGLTSDEDHESDGGIPVLKDIPILGHLFKKSSKKVDRRDLIIFVTPHIIRTTGLDVAMSSVETEKEDSLTVNIHEENFDVLDEIE